MHLVLNFILNSAPWPISLLTTTFPPICSTIYLQIDRPRPVPPLFCSWFSCNFRKSMNRCRNPSLEIPIPLSIILISKAINFSVVSSSPSNIIFDKFFLFWKLTRLISNLIDFFFGIISLKLYDLFKNSFLTIYSSLILILIVIYPLVGVNFKELDIKLIRICLMRLLSP